MQYLLGYDIGPSSTRNMLIDSNRTKLECAFEKCGLYSSKAGWSGQEPSIWWDSIIKVTNANILRI